MFQLQFLICRCSHAGVWIHSSASISRSTGPTFNQMRLDNLDHIRRTDMAIPDRVGIHDKVGTMLALVKAAGLIDADAIFESRRADRLVEQFMQLRLSIGIAAGASASGFAPVGVRAKRCRSYFGKNIAPGNVSLSIIIKRPVGLG